jgi:retinol-binding protein 3
MFGALTLAVVTVLTPTQIGGLLAKAEAAFHDYVFPHVAARAVSMLKSNAPRYETISDPAAFAAAVNADLLAVTRDRHVHIEYPFDSAMFGTPESMDAMHREEQELNYGFRTVRRLPGNVGYIDFRFFSGDPSAAAVIASAMSFVANTDALIIDLRNNHGGDPRSAQMLEGYLFADQQQITSIVERDPKTGALSETQQYTAPMVAGTLYLNKRVYLLTSHHTFSCAEQFAYDLHNLKRVTIVGETTGGGANPGGFEPLGGNFAIFIPTGRAYSPVTKTNWEGTGIAPDIAVPASTALTTAYVTALKSIRGTGDKRNASEIDKLLADPAAALAFP